MEQNKNRIFIILFILVFFPFISKGQKKLDFFILAGQSNAQGWMGDAAYYPEEGKQLDDSILFNWTFVDNESSNGKWQKMQPQKGRFPKGHFGPEVSFSRELKKAGYKPAIFKYTKGATGLARDWKAPGGGGIYDRMARDLKSAMNKLEKQGFKVIVRGFIWIQGETDAGNEKTAREYYFNLKRLIDDLRNNVLHKPALKIILGVDEQHRFVKKRPEVLKAQKKLAKEDTTISLTSMLGLPKADGTHLTPKGLVKHGIRLFKAYIEMTDAHFKNTSVPDSLFISHTFAFAQSGKKIKKSFAGEKSEWKGFLCYDFQFEKRAAHVIVPDNPLRGNPWVWRARFPEWHTEMDSLLLSEGFHIAYIDTNNMYGSPAAVKVWSHFYNYLTAEFGLHPKVTLEAVSRGALFIYNWAKRNPEKVNCIYAEAPVCDFKSWPGGFGEGKGSEPDWERLKNEYGFSSDIEAKKYGDNPIDNLRELALAKVPILHMIGLNDQVVPPEENTYILVDRYIKLGGSATVIPCTLGKQDSFGHHFQIETPQLGADFIKYHTQIPDGLLNPSIYHNYREGIRNSLLKFQREKKGRVAFLGGSITYNGGWRDSICNYLKNRFPETKFEFIAAGIPSMGTTPAAFRLERDVLAGGPVDLLFEEGAVNDALNGRSNKEQIRAMEGIVRHVRGENPATDIVIMHFVDPEKMSTYRSGQVPEVIQNHEKVAVHYNIPTLNLAKEVTERIDAGEFTWEDDFENLHPSPFGQRIYFRSMKAFLEKAWTGAVAKDDKIKAYPQPEPLDDSNYDNGVLIDINNAHILSGWQLVENWKPDDGMGTRANYVKVPMLVAQDPDSTVELQFTGNAIGITVASGPDAGIVEYRIDNGNWQKQDLFTKWSVHLHLPWYYTLATSLPNEEHTLQLRTFGKKNPQSNGTACRIRYFFLNQ